MRPRPLAVALVAALSLIMFVVQATVLRPHLYPAGAGLTLSGDAIMNELAEQSALGFAHLPDPRAALGRPVTITAVRPGSPAAEARLTEGMIVTEVESGGRRVRLGEALPDDAAAVMATWAEMYRFPPTGAIAMTVVEAPGGKPRRVTLERPAVWSLDGDTWLSWFGAYHGALLAKHLVYTLAALLIVALGASGITATLITLAFLLMGATDPGPLMGAEWQLPLLGPVLLVVSWVIMSISFPIIGLAILYFPTRGPLLDRYPWIAPSLWLVNLPLGVMGGISAAYLLGVDQLGPAVTWLATRPWIFNIAFTVGLFINVAIVTYAVHRFRINPDVVARRRAQSVMITAVPGMLAYVLITVGPIVASNAGMPFRWPWPVAAVLEFVVLLSALGMAYAVAVRRAMSPRTALRQGIQYALARRTLGLLTTLPIVALVVALVRQSDQPLSETIRGRPVFYITSLVLIALGLKYRDVAQKWLDRRFFRAEYDAREILLSLASRVPQETDPRALLSLVLADVESALHPSSLAVLAERDGTYDVIEARHLTPSTLAAGSGLLQLLQWSDAPLEVFLNDPRSTVGRLPASDREWLQAASAALLVPISSGSAVERPLVGVLVLGAKRSEESYTSEDRRLLAAIAAQMGVAIDLSRLRQQVAATPHVASDAPAPTSVPGAAAAAVEVGATIDGKYRVDALVGRGGMGAVYRARDTRLDRDVALKVLRGDLMSSPAARERFKREAQLSAKLQHPAVVTVFDFGTLPDGSAYLIMEFVRGEDLRARLMRGTLDWKDAARLLAAVADGVEAAHREHILHRDLKPENVLLPEQGGGPKVLDFGVAKMMASVETEGTITIGGTIVGTPAYMAPEQLRGEPVDARADIYSLAVMAYEMLTGRLPFGQGSFVDVAVRQQTPEGPALDAVPIPDALASVLRRALSFEPNQRPESAVAFAAALREALGE